MQIRLAAPLSYDSIVDGLGMRIVIWTQGCPHHCEQCHNPQTHDFNAGSMYDIDQIVEQIRNYPLKSGVTLSGGEPFAQPKALLELVKGLKDKKINIWAYTGYVYEKLITDKEMKEILNYIDVLVDGPFIYQQKDLTLRFRGSKNQRIIDVQKSLTNQKIILLSF